MKILATLLLLSLSVHAETVKLRSADALTTAYEPSNQKFVGSLKAGFHFNDKAPNAVTVDGNEVKPSSLAKQKIEFKVPKTFSEGRASLYVCDDAVTFCETHSIEFKGGSKASAVQKAKPQALASGNKIKVNAAGFMENAFEQALSEGKAKNKLILADFSARWCPGCVRYEKEVFSTSQFKKSFKDVIKVKIDVDKFENFALTEKFNVKAIPTLVIMNSDQQEISRVIDFQSMESLQSFLNSANQNPTPMQALMAQSQLDPKQSLQLGQRLLASGRAAESVTYFEKVNPAPPELLKARIEVAEAKNEGDKATDETKKNLIQELRAALAKEGQSSRSIAWRTQLVGLLDAKSTEVQKIKDEGVAVADKALKEPTFLNEALKTDELGEFVGFEKLWVAMLKADLVEASGSSPEAISAAWNEAADIGASYKVPADRSGPALRYLIVLTAAKKYVEAETLANAILKKDPKNTDVKRRKLKVLLGLNKSAEAITLGEKILPEAEGRNEFWVAETLAKAYIAANKKTEAKRLITAYLARPEIQTDKMKSSKKSLEELLKTANAGA